MRREVPPQSKWTKNSPVPLKSLAFQCVDNPSPHANQLRFPNTKLLVDKDTDYKDMLGK